MNKKERVICEFEMNLETRLCWCSNLSNDYIEARSENGCGK